AAGARVGQAESQVAAYFKSRSLPGTVHGVNAMLVDSDRRGLAQLTVRVDVAAGDVSRATKAIEDLDLAHRRGLEPETLNYVNTAATLVEVWAGGKKAGEATVKRSGLNPRTLTPPDDEPGRGTPVVVAPSTARGEQGARGDQGARGARGDQGARGATGAAGAAGAEAAQGAATPEGVGAGPGGGTAPPASPAATEAGGGGGPFGAQVAPVPAKTFDLSSAYSIDGWFGDSYVDLIPDRLETAIVVGDAKESFGAAHIATRLGLETTGITLPLARDARKITNAAAEPNPILVGR